MSKDSSAQHPLKSPWRLWYMAQVSYDVVSSKFGGDYNAAMNSAKKDICNLESVEELWSALNVMPPPAVLPAGDTVALMRDGKKPEFEDFPKGGRLVLTEIPDMADKLVERVIIAVLGQQTEVPLREKVCGDAPSPFDLCGAVRVARRKKKGEDNVRVEVWITDKSYGTALSAYFTELLIEDKVDVKYEDF
eukprot:272521_1